MFSSAKKYLEDSAKSATSGADQLLTHTRGFIKTVKVYDNCFQCNTQISILGNYLTSQNTCRICCKLFCNDCIAKSSVNVPNYLLDISYQNKNTYTQPERQFLCINRCTPRVINICMHEFRKEITQRFEDFVNRFMSNELQQHFFFNIPKGSPEDTAYRKALRMIHIAGMVAGFSGYALTYNAVKYAYYSSELVNILTEGNIIGILTPLHESLKQCGIQMTGPTAILRLYYLGCYHTLQAKMNTSKRSLLYNSTETGVIYSECPLIVLEYINSYLSAAQWMYLSCLPPPHHETDWGSWYLSQIIRRQGWSLLMCINESTKIPDGSKCPAFALVTRCFYPSIDTNDTDSAEQGKGDTPPEGQPIREAMLVIRGSNSVMDWSINLEEEMRDYSYTHIVRKDQVFVSSSQDPFDETYSSAEKNNTYSSNSNTTASGSQNTTAELDVTLITRTVQGVIHKGLYTAAMGLLEGYNLRPVLMRLLNAGYQIKVVGHSLGAGIAALIAAELRISLITKHLEIYENPESVCSSSKSSASGTTSASNKIPNGADTSGNTRQARTTASIPTTIPTSASNTSTSAAAGPGPGSAFPCTSSERPTSGLRVPSYLPSTVSKISAIIFSSPAFCTMNLAEAFQHDRILINTVYDKDIIPRFSFKTIELIAEELKDPTFCTQADLWTQEDKADFSAYAVSMGKAADINRATTATANPDTSNLDTANSKNTNTTTTADAVLNELGAVSIPETQTTGVPDTVPDASGKPPLKPIKPPKLDRTTSVESYSSYCTADGEDCPLTPKQTCKSSTTDHTVATGIKQSGSSSSSSSSSNNSVPPTTTASTASADPASGSGGSKMSSFLHSVGAWQTLASSAIETLQSVNNNMGASAEVIRNRPVETTATTTATTSSIPMAAVATVVPVEPDSAPSNIATAVKQKQQQQQGQETPVSAPKPSKPHTVTPGPIVHLYKENDGTVHAAVVTHMHSAFQRMQIIPAHSADDHLMSTVREGMRSALFQHRLTPLSHEAKPKTMTNSSENLNNRHSNTNNSSDIMSISAHTNKDKSSTTQNNENRKKFESVFDIPLSGAHRYYPPAGTGPNLLNISKSKISSGNTSSSGGGGTAAAAIAVGDPGNVPKIGVEANHGTTTSSENGATTTATTTAPPKIHRSISTDSEFETLSATAAAATHANTSAKLEQDHTIDPTTATTGTSTHAASTTNNLSPTSAAPQTASSTRSDPLQSAGRLSPLGKPGSNLWVPCSVCGLDVTWPYVLHSNASRAVVAHNCRKCGEVVCSLCSPAGDSLPGDGLNQSYQLADYRVSLPESGLFSPQRVCLLCYFDT